MVYLNIIEFVDRHDIPFSPVIGVSPISITVVFLDFHMITPNVIQCISFMLFLFYIIRPIASKLLLNCASLIDFGDIVSLIHL